MFFRHGLNWLSGLILVAGLPLSVFGQVQQKALILQVEATVEAKEDVAEKADDKDAEDEVAVRQEITVKVSQDGQKLTVTQSVDGDFAGEITKNEETTAIKAKSLQELKEKFPAAHEAFLAKPTVPALKAGAQAAVSVKMSDNNGDRKVEATEPGRKIVMRDQQGKQLDVTIQQDLEHGTRTERYEAPHLDALRKTYPEVAQLVKQYKDGAIGFGGNVNLQVQAVPFRAGQRVGGGFGGQGGVVAGPRKIIGEHEGQRVVIRDEGGRNIKITITEMEGDEEKTEEYEAENYATLKKNHPEIAPIYEKLAGKDQPVAQNPNGGIIVGNGIQIQVQAQPAPAAVLPNQRVQLTPEQELAIAKRILDQSRQRLEKVANDPNFADAEAVKKLAEDLAATLKKLEELEAKTKK